MESEKKDSMFTKYAESLAKDQAEELKSQNKLMLPEDQFVKNKTEQLVLFMEKERENSLQRIKKAKHLLVDNLQSLPEAEMKSRALEILIAIDKIGDEITLNQVEEATSWQKFLGFTNETMIWIYTLGHQLFEKKNYEDASSLFQLLTLLNPLFSDYWIALGFTQENLHLEYEASASFIMASFLDPDNPTPKYQISKIYIKMEKFEDAVVELEALSKMIEEKHLDSLKKDVEFLLNKAKNKQSL